MKATLGFSVDDALKMNEAALDIPSARLHDRTQIVWYHLGQGNRRPQL